MATVPTPECQAQLLALMPNMRAFARSLCHSPHEADDLVQEALIRAWKNWDRFTPDTNLKAWLFTILRNAYLSERRKRKNEVQDADGVMAGQLSAKGGQLAHMEFLDFQKAFDRLPADQKEALVLIGAEGFSYEEAALMCGCAVGTMKSRVNRARVKLAELMGLEAGSEIGNDEPGFQLARVAG